MNNDNAHGTSQTRPNERGLDELRRIKACLDYAKEDGLEVYTAEQLLNIVRACWRSGWDIYPDDLTPREREYAMKFGKVSNTCMGRLKKELG